MRKKYDPFKDYSNLIENQNNKIENYRVLAPLIKQIVEKFHNLITNIYFTGEYFWIDFTEKPSTHCYCEFENMGLDATPHDRLSVWASPGYTVEFRLANKI